MGRVKLYSLERVFLVDGFPGLRHAVARPQVLVRVPAASRLFRVGVDEGRRWFAELMWRSVPVAGTLRGTLLASASVASLQSGSAPMGRDWPIRLSRVGLSRWELLASHEWKVNWWSFEVASHALAL